jgi:hypothetical protein
VPTFQPDVILVDMLMPVQPGEQWPRRGVCRDLQARLRDRRRAPGRRGRLGAAGQLVHRLQHPGAALGARDAEPGRVSDWRYSKLLAVSRRLGSTPCSSPFSGSWRSFASAELRRCTALR